MTSASYLARLLVVVGLVGVPQASASSPPSIMRALQASGKPCTAPTWDCLTVNSEAPVPRPGIGQALVKMLGSSVNPVNVDMVEPRCKDELFGFLCSKGTIGADGAGVVAAVGFGCRSLSVGDEVWGEFTGAYAEYALTYCAAATKKPKTLNFTDAGTIPTVGLTSLECLKKAGAPWGKNSNISVVVTGGQGGTGFIGIQLAKALGASRVITAATGAGIAMVKALGADVVIDYHEQDIFDVLGNNSVDVVYDNIGFKGTADKAMHSIRPGGTFVLLPGGGGGQLSKKPKEGVKQVNFGFTTPSAQGMASLADFFDVGLLRPHTLQVYGLAEVPDAFTRSLGHGVLGKIAIDPSARGADKSSTIVV